MEPSDFGHPIRTAGIEGGRFRLGGGLHLAEHLGGSRKIELAMGLQLLDTREQVARAGNVGVQTREAIVEALADETLGGEMIALVEAHAAKEGAEGGIALE